VRYKYKMLARVLCLLTGCIYIHKPVWTIKKRERVSVQKNLWFNKIKT